MSPDNIEIVQYRPEHRTQVIELQKDLWSPSAENNAACLEWKHLRNPYVSEPLVYLAMNGGRIVGMRGFFGTKWQFGSPRQTVVVPCAGDLIVVPEFRNRGLVTRIMQASLRDLATKGYRYVFSMSAGPTTLLSQMAMGWRSIGSLQAMGRVPVEKKSFPRLRRVLTRSPLLVSMYRRVRGMDTGRVGDAPNALPNPFAQFDRRVEECRHRIDPCVIIERAPRPEAMTELVARLEDDERLRHVRDEQYFAWRFQNPRGSYRFLFWEDKRLEGYLVVYFCHYSGESHFSIVDWEATSHRVRKGLMHALVQLGGFRELRTWSATLGSDERRVLKEAGFQRIEQSITSSVATVLARPTGDDFADAEWALGNQRLLDIGNWDLRMIYSEGF